MLPLFSRFADIETAPPLATESVPRKSTREEELMVTTPLALTSYSVITLDEPEKVQVAPATPPARLIVDPPTLSNSVTLLPTVRVLPADSVRSPSTSNLSPLLNSAEALV